MRVEDGFLQADRAHAERVAHDDHGELDEHEVEAAPNRRPADGRNGAIDAVGEVLDGVAHGFGRTPACDVTGTRDAL